LMPQAYDQFPLAWRIGVLGAGRIVRESAGAVRDCVRWLLDDPSGRLRAQELRRHLRRYDSERRVAAILDEVLAGGPARAA